MIQSKTTTQILFDSLPDAMFRIGSDGTLLDFKAAKNFSVQLPPKNFLGCKIGEILPKELAIQVMQHIERSLALGRVGSFEYQTISPHPLANQGEDKEEWRDFEARIVPSDTAEVLVIVRDVTERKRSEQSLAKSEERYRVVSELTSDFAYAARINVNGNLILDWITGAFSRISGFCWQEISARGGWQTLIHPDDQSIFQERVQTLLCWQSDISEYRIFTKDGAIRWLRDYSQPVQCEEQDSILLVYGAAQDITERKAAEAALRQQSERERLIRRMQERIRQSLNLDEILSKVVKEVRRFLQVERVTVYQFHPQAEVKFVVESVESGCCGGLNSPLLDLFGDGDSVQKYQQGRVCAINDIEEDNIVDCDRDLLSQLGIRAILLVPIVLNRQLWGLLCAHQCSAPRSWERFEIESLQQLATQVAIAIQQSQLYQQYQKLSIELEQQVQERTYELQKALKFEEMLRGITEEVRANLDENRILQKAVEELAVGLGMRGCNASLYDLDQGTSTICYEFAVDIPAEQGRVARMADFPELYNQLLKEEYLIFCSIPYNPVRGRVAMFACPICDDQGVLGDLWLINHHNYMFSDLEVRLVQQVANQCAIAIRQARLYQASQAQVADLAKLNQLKDDFVSAVSHELRTPMANMKMAIQMLQLASTPEQRQRYLEILKSECQRETELINDLLELQRLEAGSSLISLADELNLPEWIPTIVAAFYSRAQNYQQNLQVELSSDLSPLCSDRAALGRIIAELLNNACKYTIAGGAIILRVFQQKGEISTTIFSVSNQAQIPPEEIPHLFEKFYRVPKIDLWKQGGTGLGLALVQKLVEQMQGTIQVESIDGWTKFRVELPTNPLVANGD